MSNTHFSGPLVSEAGFQNGTRSVVDITAGRTLTADDNGKTFVLADAAPGDITLPQVSNVGFRCRVYTGFAITTNATIVPHADDASSMEGHVLVAGAVVGVATGDVVTFVATAENIGDYVEFISDGTYWFVSGMAAFVGGVTSA